MKDIDFDELDRAVTSLMSGVPKAEAAKEENLKSLVFETAAPAVNSQQDSSSEVTVKNTADSTQAKSRVDERSKLSPGPTVPVTRQRGQFMDMVRQAPPESKNPARQRPISRQGVTLQPNTATPDSESIMSYSVTPVTRNSNNLGLKEQPEPLEEVDFNKTTEAVAMRVRQAESLSLEETIPQQSPFLPDTKVEKRPLGRSPESDTTAQDLLETDYIASPKPSMSSSDDDMYGAEQKADRADTAKQPLPVELGRDVVAIESDTGSLSDQSSRSPVSFSPPAARPALTSIQQQYKVQPKATEPVPGAIYDTTAYRQPLSHPAKKRSGWLWVLAIVMILILGAASGAAVYFLDLI